MLPLPPPSRLNCFDAKRYALPVVLGGHGLSVRRVNWNSIDPGGPAAPNEALRWIRWQDGLFFLRSASEDRVLLDTDIGLTDIEAEDWTTEAPAPTKTDWTNPNYPIGTTGGSGSTTGSDGTPAVDSASSGGGSGGSGSVPSPRPRPRPPVPAVALTVTCARTSGDSCIALLEGDIPNPDPITDTFNITVALAGAAAPGLWFFTCTYGSPTGPRVALHGTIIAGGSQATAISITAPAGLSFGIHATAYKPHTAYTAAASASAIMRVNCGHVEIGCPLLYAGTLVNIYAMALGDTVTRTVVATTTGGHTISYQWSFGVVVDGHWEYRDISGATSDTLTLSNGGAASPGYVPIIVKCTSDCGSVAYASFAANYCWNLDLPF